MPTRQISWTLAIVAMTVLQVAGAAAQAGLPESDIEKLSGTAAKPSRDC
mgnify:CR=1 FL=1